MDFVKQLTALRNKLHRQKAAVEATEQLIRALEDLESKKTPTK